MLAVLYDIHGNLPALEAVIADARAAGAERFLLGGDYAAFGPHPREAVAACEALEPVAMLRGNHERWLTDDHDQPDNPALRAAIAWELAQLDAATVARLGDLPTTHAHGDTLFCHAAPATDMRSFLPGPDPADTDLLEGVTARRVVFGHLHVQFTRVDETTGIELVGPGSVGLPLDGDERAAYALFAPDGGIELRRVAYDVGATRRALAALGEDWTATFAPRQSDSP